jgi:5-methylcytosine-specific restriction endonuclease McrA
MFCSEHEPLASLIELTPKLAKKRFREDIYKAWEHRCGYCGDTATSLDHIVPKFKSGSSCRHNLLPCCRRCNQSKASEEMESWYKKQTDFSEQNLAKIKHWMSNEILEISDIFSFKAAC